MTTTHAILFEATVTTRGLYAAMVEVVTAADKRHRAIKPLTHVLIRLTEHGAVTFTCTDMERAARRAISASDTSGAGAVAIPAKTLRKIAGELRTIGIDAPVRLTGTTAPKTAVQDDVRIRIACGDCTYELYALPEKDFPLTDERFFSTCEHHQVTVPRVARLLDDQTEWGFCRACGVRVEAKHIRALRPEKDGRHGIYWEGAAVAAPREKRIALAPPMKKRATPAPTPQPTPAAVGYKGIVRVAF